MSPHSGPCMVVEECLQLKSGSPFPLQFPALFPILGLCTCDALAEIGWLERQGFEQYTGVCRSPSAQIMIDRNCSNMWISCKCIFVIQFRLEDLTLEVLSNETLTSLLFFQTTTKYKHFKKMKQMMIAILWVVCLMSLLPLETQAKWIDHFSKILVSNSVHSEVRLTSWLVCPPLLKWSQGWVDDRSQNEEGSSELIFLTWPFGQETEKIAFRIHSVLVPFSLTELSALLFQGLT